MNFLFSSPRHGTCVVKLWATGRYGFSLPKRVDIAAPGGPACTFLFLNKQLTLTEPDNRTIVRIAIAAFLADTVEDGATVDIDPDMPAYGGKLTPVRLDVPRAPMRVRPGKSHARQRPDAACGSD
jgi:hypothetical protein